MPQLLSIYGAVRANDKTQLQEALAALNASCAVILANATDAANRTSDAALKGKHPHPHAHTLCPAPSPSICTDGVSGTWIPVGPSLSLSLSRSQAAGGGGGGDQEQGGGRCGGGGRAQEPRGR
jgi:hypothetical protein